MLKIYQKENEPWNMATADPSPAPSPSCN